MLTSVWAQDRCYDCSDCCYTEAQGLQIQIRAVFLFSAVEKLEMSVLLSYFVLVVSTSPNQSVYGVKPRNLNQKRTQTRPKAVGTICPFDVAGREI